MTRSPLRRRLRVMLLALLGANLLLFGAWTLPRVLHERGVLGRAESLARDLERERARVEDLRAYERLIRDNVSDARKLMAERLQPRASSLLPLLEEVEAAALAAGLHLRTRSYDQQPVGSLPVVRVQINLPVEGSYSQLVRFVETLEHSERFLVVDRLQLREGGRNAAAELSVVLSAFFRLDAEEAHGA